MTMQFGFWEVILVAGFGVFSCRGSGTVWRKAGVTPRRLPEDPDRRRHCLALGSRSWRNGLRQNSGLCVGDVLTLVTKRMPKRQNSPKTLQTRNKQPPYFGKLHSRCQMGKASLQPFRDVWLGCILMSTTELQMPFMTLCLPATPQSLYASATLAYCHLHQYFDA